MKESLRHDLGDIIFPPPSRQNAKFEDFKTKSPICAGKRSGKVRVKEVKARKDLKLLKYFT
jgi:hypothetical protein